jgi:hypothetical protein
MSFSRPTVSNGTTLMQIQYGTFKVCRKKLKCPDAQDRLVSGGARAGAALPVCLHPPCHASRHAHHVQLLPAHQQRMGKVRIILE